VPSRIKEGRFKHCTAELGYKKKKKKNGKNWGETRAAMMRERPVITRIQLAVSKV
jgi:hypothetical protein